MTAASLVAEHQAAGRRLAVAELSTFVREAGDGPPVVLLHGASTSSFMYRKVLPLLAERGLRAIAFDLPGQGLADRPDADAFDYSWSGLGRFAEQALDALGLQDAHLVVHDIGGPVGFELAARRPDRIRSLTMLNTLLAVDRFKVPFVNRPFRVRGLGELYLSTMTRPAFTLLAYRLLTSRAATTPDEVAAYLALLKRGDGGRGFLHTMRGFELTEAKHLLWRDALRAAPYPIQAVWGTEDPVLAADREGAVIRDELDLVGFRRVAAKHLVADQQPLAVAEEVAQLVRRVEGWDAALV